MNNSIELLIEEKEEIKLPENQIGMTDPSAKNRCTQLIPRHQNQMIAERTKDMFLSGLMCE